MQRELSPGIISDPEILGGKPTIKGQRIAVSQLLGQLAGGERSRSSRMIISSPVTRCGLPCSSPRKP